MGDPDPRTERQQEGAGGSVIEYIRETLLPDSGRLRHGVAPKETGSLSALRRF